MKIEIKNCLKEIRGIDMNSYGLYRIVHTNCKDYDEYVGKIILLYPLGIVNLSNLNLLIVEEVLLQLIVVPLEKGVKVELENEV